MKKNKVIALIVVISFLGVLLFPGLSFAATDSAATVAKIQAQINALLAKLKVLQAQLAQVQNQPAKWCHDFNVNLKIGDRGKEVAALERVLVEEGFSVTEHSSNFPAVFDERMASAVVGFQEKYKEDVLAPWGLKHGTGFVGKTTRTKLNELYGCKKRRPEFINQPPVIYGISGPTVLKIGQIGKWTVKASDPEKGILTYRVSWGDEPKLVPEPIQQTKSTYVQTATFTHSYSKAGIYHLTFTVTDNKGASARSSISVDVGGATSTTSFITVLSPNGGESYKTGDFILIRWNYHDIVRDRQYYDISLYRNGVFWQKIKTVSAIDQPPLPIPWRIPASIPTGSGYKIRVSLVEDARVFDESDAPFTITNTSSSSLQVLSPNGGEKWTKGTVQTIKWRDANIYDMLRPLYDIKLIYSLGLPLICKGENCPPHPLLSPDRIYTIAESVPADEYKWTVGQVKGGAVLPLGLYYRVQVCLYGSSVCDSSDSTFSIVESTTTSVTLLSPNGGEVFTQGGKNIIKWNGGKDIVQVGLVKKETTNNVNPVILGWINVNALPNDSLVWDGKQICGLAMTSCRPVTPGKYKIIVASRDNDGDFILWDSVNNKPGNWDVSDAPFSIVAAEANGIDFTVENAIITPSIGIVGEEIILSFSIMNRGNATFYWNKYGKGVQWSVDYLNSTNGYNSTARIISDGCNTSIIIVPGAGCGVKMEITFNDAGIKEIPITADYVNLVPESNEKNNSKLITTTIQSLSPPL